MGFTLKKILFRLLSFENYLFVLSKGYFISYDLGLLKSNSSYDYHYYLKEIINKGNTVVDIGANLGYYSRNFARWTGKEGQVHAYEPVPPIYRVLTKNLKKYSNVSIHPFALGEEDKEISLGNNTLSNRGYVASGSNFILDSDGQEQAETTFDAVMKNASNELGRLGKIDFIKCDVEGHEYYILSQINDILRRWKPKVLVESHGDNRNKVIDLFTNIGYKGFLLINGELVDLEKTNDHHKDILFIYNC